MIVYRCEDSLESIFTAVYDAYERRVDHRNTRLTLEDELLLFAEYADVSADTQKAVKVIRTLKNKFGEENYLWLCFALSSPSPEKAQAVYQTVVQGISGRCAEGHLFDNLADDHVRTAFTLARGAVNENQHLRGFLRFGELENGVMYSSIGPKNNLLTFLAPHFAERFPMEKFIIYDDRRGILAVHPAGKEWYLIHGDGRLSERGVERVSVKEQEYRELFRMFCHTIAIKERRNLNLQRNMLPLRFQEYMLEFNK